MVSVQELRDKIIASGIDVETVNNIKGKANLVNFLESLEKTENFQEEKVNETFAISDEDLNEVLEPIKSSDKSRPSIQDPNWTQYVLGQLTDDEKDGDFPKVDGLRRLVEKEIAIIVQQRTMVLQTPNINNGYIATVKSELTLQNESHFEAIADAAKNELMPPYDKYISAIAETRAEGRVYRKALRLKNVVTREEISDSQSTESGITNVQMNLIDVLCNNDRLNINVEKLLSNIFKDKVKEGITKYSHEEGVLISKTLNDYQANVDKIPQELKGFNPNWKN